MNQRVSTKAFMVLFALAATLPVTAQRLDEATGVYWLRLDKDQKSQLLTGFFLALYTAYGIFRETSIGPALYDLVPWYVAPVDLVPTIDLYYSDRSRWLTPLWVVLLEEGKNAHERYQTEEKRNTQAKGFHPKGLDTSVR